MLKNNIPTNSDANIRLGTLQPGARGIIVEIGAANEADMANEADRLREIGFAEGLDFEVMQQSPFGQDPIAVAVGGMTVALRRRDANLIIVETL